LVCFNKFKHAEVTMYDENPNNPPENSDSQGEIQTSGSSSAPKSARQAPTQLTCPYCRKPFYRDATQSMPFCSSRCKQIDLGLWLNESHGIPFEADPENYNGSDFESE
jgi:endogenous inhibitor of DNA gyrase (YacG/DUF329 family)